MNNSSQLKDEFLELLNDPISYDHNKIQEEQWVFGNTNNFEMKFEQQSQLDPFYEAPMPSRVRGRQQRSDTIFGAQLLTLTDQMPKREDLIIMQNQELLKANQSKSVYLSKISNLIERPFSPSEKTPSSKSPKAVQIQQKIARKTSNGKQESDSSSDNFTSDQQQSKLAKNRESAKNSRKRKKMYVELLENKVQELQQKINKIEIICNSQRVYIEHSQNLHSKVDVLLAAELQGIDELANTLRHNQPTNPVLHMMDVVQATVGVMSPSRLQACQYFLQSLITFSQTQTMRSISDHVLMQSGIFADNQSEQMMNIQSLLSQQALIWQQSVQQICEHYNLAILSLFEFEKLQTELVYVLGSDGFANLILSLNRDSYNNDEMKGADDDIYRKIIKTQ